MALRVLDMVVSVVMEIVLQIDRTRMVVAVVDMEVTTTHLLPIPLAVC
jgi:hypothetical protein